MAVEIASARVIARSVLEARFAGTASCAPDDPDLAAFQRDAVARLDMAISRYGGAILADSVGLGKTYVGAALARRALGRGLQLLLVTPPALRRQWLRALPDKRVRMLSHATLGRTTAHISSTRAPAGMLILVDEAHAFRNRATRRYRALAALTRGARVLLITATPVNNSLDDLYWLLRLFAGDATFGCVGIPDLRACFEHAKRTGGAGRIPSVLAQVMVRRTRSLLLDIHGTVELPGGALRFPRREPPVPVRYVTSGSWRTLLRHVEALELQPWSERPGRGADLLLRLLLLRRAESSRAAALASFQVVDSALESMIAAIEQGLDPHGARTRRPARATPDGQLTLAALLLAPLASHVESAQLAASLRRDRARITAVLAALRAQPDAKLSALRDLLRSIDGRPVVLFTEFRETAVQLHRELRTDFRAGLVHGGEARLGDACAGRRTVIERFAPIANGAPVPPARERVQLLITTDVLSEGLNLHDAADLISYDLPWNPVRLIQRVGRIDRLGSRHPSIRSYHFVPARDLERSLGLVRRLRRKLHAIGVTIGLDEAVLADRTRDLVAVVRGDATALERIEQHDALIGDVAERLRAAWLRLRHDEAARLPLFEAPAPLAMEPPVRHADPAGTPVGRVSAAVPLPAALGRAGGPIACVFVETDGVQRAWLVRGRIAVEDERATGALLLAALSAPERVVLTASQLTAARRAIRRATAQVAAPVPAQNYRSVLPALRKRLLVQLERIPGGPTVEECVRAEAALRALEHCTAGTELALRERLHEFRRLPLDALCAALLAASGPEASGKGAGDGATPAAQDADRPRVVPGIGVLGVLMVQSSGALPAVDSSRPAR